MTINKILRNFLCTENPFLINIPLPCFTGLMMPLTPPQTHRRCDHIHLPYLYLHTSTIHKCLPVILPYLPYLLSAIPAISLYLPYPFICHIFRISASCCLLLRNSTNTLQTESAEKMHCKFDSSHHIMLPYDILTSIEQKPIYQILLRALSSTCARQHALCRRRTIATKDDNQMSHCLL